MVYIAIEGVDGVGKTTIIEQMKPYLHKFTKQFGLPEIKYIAETEIKCELSGDDIFDAHYLALAYQIQRMDLHKPLNKYKDIIISDRSILSTFVYQGQDLETQVIEKIVEPLSYPYDTIILRNYKSELEFDYVKKMSELGLSGTVFSAFQEGTLKQVLRRVMKTIFVYHCGDITNEFLEENL